MITDEFAWVCYPYGIPPELMDEYGMNCEYEYLSDLIL